MYIFTIQKSQNAAYPSSVGSDGLITPIIKYWQYLFADHSFTFSGTNGWVEIEQGKTEDAELQTLTKAILKIVILLYGIMKCRAFPVLLKTVTWLASATKH